MVEQFIDREQELSTLREFFQSDRFELIMLYGRRRVGKTELIKHAAEPFSHLYYLAIEENNLSRFARECIQYDSSFRQFRQDYEVLFEALKNKVQIVIIDEFQNMIKENPAIISLFQALVDLILKSSKIKLVLLGSSTSIMQSRVLEYSSPLYGRRTASILVNPMTFHQMQGFFSKANFLEMAEIYGFADGIPAYLQEVAVPFWDWLYKNLVSLKSIFRDEVDFLLRYEFDNPSMYRQILNAIAHGKTKLNEIKQYIAVQRTDISPYLRNLIEIGLVFREVPVTESEQSRLGRYYIRDNFIKFWFRFIYPSLSALEGGFFQIEKIQAQYPSYMGFVFEQIARQHLITHPIFPFTKIGRWWGAAGEIDIVALDPDTPRILFGS